MGCPSLTYHPELSTSRKEPACEKSDHANFLGLWKTSAGPEKSYKYYPFGLQTSTSWTRENVKDNNMLYNAANELNKTSGWYEMYYRGYDPAIGRMLQVDPYATSFASSTTYNYALNNPVMLNDPSGGYVYANAAADRINKINDRNNPNYFSDWAESFRTDGMQMRYDADQVSMGNMSKDAFLDRYATSYRDQTTISAFARQWRNGDAVLFQFNSQGKVSNVQYIDLVTEYTSDYPSLYAVVAYKGGGLSGNPSVLNIDNTYAMGPGPGGPGLRKGGIYKPKADGGSGWSFADRDKRLKKEAEELKKANSDPSKSYNKSDYPTYKKAAWNVLEGFMWGMDRVILVIDPGHHDLSHPWGHYKTILRD